MPNIVEIKNKIGKQIENKKNEIKKTKIRRTNEKKKTKEERRIWGKSASLSVFSEERFLIEHWRFLLRSIKLSNHIYFARS